MKTLKFTTGDSVKIINDACGHLFPIGTIVRLEVDEQGDCYKAYSGDTYWWVDDRDIAPIDTTNEKRPIIHTWIKDECSICGEQLRSIIGYYDFDFPISKIAFCPFCGDKKER